MTLIKKIVVIMLCFIILLGIGTSVKGERDPETGEILPTHTFYVENNEDLMYFDWLYNGDIISGLRFSNAFTGGNNINGANHTHRDDIFNDEYKNYRYYCVAHNQDFFQNGPSGKPDIRFDWTVEKVREINKKVIDTGYFEGIEISSDGLIELARYAFHLRNNEGHSKTYNIDPGGWITDYEESTTQKLLWYYSKAFYKHVAAEFGCDTYDFTAWEVPDLDDNGNEKKDQYGNTIMKTIHCTDNEECKNGCKCTEGNHVTEDCKCECYILNEENAKFDKYWNDIQYVNGELNIDTSKAKQEIYEEEGKKYLSYGPITFKDKKSEEDFNKYKNLDNFILSINGEEKTYKTDYWVYRSVKENEDGINGRKDKDPEDVEPGEEFYISIDTDKLSNNSTIKISAKIEYPIYGAKLVLLSNNEQQELILVKTNQENVEHAKEIEFKAENTGKLNIKKKAQKEDGTEIYIAGGKYKIYEETKPNEVIKEVTINNATEGVTIENLAPGKYIVEEIEAPEGFKVELQADENKKVEATVVSGETKEIELVNIPYTNLQLQKVDADTGSSTLPIVQKGVVFKIYYEEGGTKVYIGKNFVTGTENTIAKMDWTTNENDAKEFVTGEDGKIEKLIHIPIHTYYAKEISLTEELRNYYNVKTDPDRIPLTIDDRKGDTTIEEKNIVKIANKQEFVSISGYVWKDIHNSNKATTRNNLYKEDDSDDVDEAYNKVLVTLRYKNGGKVLDKVTTNEKGIYKEIEGGEYRFSHVPIEDLKDLCIEFTYDGLLYQSVELNINKDNGSKATDKIEREILDNNSKNVVNSTNETRQSATVLNGEEKTNFIALYESATEHQLKLLGSEETWNINATTEDTYNIKEHYVAGETLEIRNINLGVYEKPQADFSIDQDLESIKVGINGQWHIYEYAKYSEADMKEDTEVWDIGVKFKKKFEATYTRPIYQSDVSYTNPNGGSGELEVYLNYKIKISNESTYIGEINTIESYYDTRYEIQAIGSSIDEKEGNVTNDIEYKTKGETQAPNGEKYKTVTINANRSLIIDEGKSKTIYLQFKMNKKAIEAALAEETSNGITIKTEEQAKTITVDRSKIDSKLLLYNIAEISSYTVYYNDGDNMDEDGNVINKDKLRTVAAVDRDSIPGNATPGEISTYEDDTDSAPPVLLVKASEKLGKRTLTGNVFEDLAEINETGKESKGNGIYDIGNEKTIDNIEVTLHEIHQEQNGIEDQTCKTEKGEYKFEEYIPGQYIITFKWGDNTYKVQNYKGTIYNEDRFNSNQGNMYWYKNNPETRYTDAIDNYDTRLSIDDQMARITDRSIYEKIDEAYKEGYTGEIITKMTSTTPTMEFGVEYMPEKRTETKTEEIDKTEGEKLNIFEVKNVDFGIIERPAQRLELRKRVASVKLILANGQELVNIKIDEDGKVTGEQNYLTYMKPEPEKRYDGNIRIEMDKELIQGATLEVGYEFIYTNTSELDYATRRYYLYGTRLTTDEPITLKPLGIVDYLDKDLVYKETPNEIKWTELTKTELDKLNLIEEHQTQDYQKDKTILYSSVEEKIKPEEKVIISLNTSKYLAITDDSEFENEADTVKIKKPTKEEPGGNPGGTPEDRIIEQHVGKVVETFPTSEKAEIVTIMQSQGENRAYVIPTIVGITALVIMGVEIVVIKKKVVK